MKWVTRERPKIDRVACPWLIARFIDDRPEFLFVPPADVMRVAAETGATPYDVEGVELSHDGALCSFDAFIRKYGLGGNEALARLAIIVRGADTARLDLAPECAGLLAVSLGLSRLFHDDHEQLTHGFTMYDALYAWHTQARDERHTWNPQRGGATVHGG
ncbi:MAG: chromate resistance protein ChrB domain-containing protein [Gemmatimonadaceae bacterium]